MGFNQKILCHNKAAIIPEFALKHFDTNYSLVFLVKEDVVPDL